MPVTSSLPAYTTMENMLKLIEALRRKNNDEEEVKPIFGMCDFTFRNTKSVLRRFGIIEESNMDFTDVGRQIAYAENDEERRNIMYSIIMNYPPYKCLLLNIDAKKEQQTELDSIIAFWGKNGYGSSERNRKQGAALFANIIKYVGFGKFIRGHGKFPSRILWNPDFGSRLQGSTVETPDKPEEKHDENFIPQNETKVLGKKITNRIPKHEVKTSYSGLVNCSNATQGPSIVIKVDMTNWSEEKIKNFFKFAYGHLWIESE